MEGVKEQHKALRAEMDRFNQWEMDYLRGLHPTQRLEQFFTLFEVASSYDDQKKLRRCTRSI